MKIIMREWVIAMRSSLVIVSQLIDNLTIFLLVGSRNSGFEMMKSN